MVAPLVPLSHIRLQIAGFMLSVLLRMGEMDCGVQKIDGRDGNWPANARAGAVCLTPFAPDADAIPDTSQNQQKSPPYG
jgi:hypothetical protein